MLNWQNWWVNIRCINFLNYHTLSTIFSVRTVETNKRQRGWIVNSWALAKVNQKWNLTKKHHQQSTMLARWNEVQKPFQKENSHMNFKVCFRWVHFMYHNMFVAASHIDVRQMKRTISRAKNVPKSCPTRFIANLWKYPITMPLSSFQFQFFFSVANTSVSVDFYNHVWKIRKSFFLFGSFEKILAFPHRIATR